MSRPSVYFARAMDARLIEDVIADDEKYSSLLGAIGARIINPFERGSRSPAQDPFSMAERDLASLKTSDIVLADLSVPNYQYVGCVFEIAHAAMNNIPVILVVGKEDLHKRVFFQAYCEFIARESADAVEYIQRVHTQEGIRKQMAEMRTYYNEIATRYAETAQGTFRHNPKEKGLFRSEREELCTVIKQYVRGKTCEIGIGDGDWTKTICQTADEVIGVEVSPEMLRQAHKNLSSYGNVRLLQCDVLEQDIDGGPFDCVVVYFLLSLLPRSMQDRLFDLIQKIMKPDGILVVADTKKAEDIQARGLGRRQLQKRKSGGITFTLYKEHFAGDSLSSSLDKA